MKKSIVAFLCAAMIGTASVPVSFADTFVNTSFTGVYKSAGATDTYGATMDIYFIDNNTFTINFSYIKDGRESFVYTFDQGTFNDTKGSVRFSAIRYDGAYTPTGTMTLELREDRILVSCDTDDGVHLFNGDMLRQFTATPSTPAPQPTQDTSVQTPTGGNETTRGSASVVINGVKYNFNPGQEPFIQDGRTYVPLRSVFSTMGMNVYWADYQYTEQLREQTITCVKNNIIVKFSRSYNDTGSNTWALTKWVDADTSNTAAGTMINTSGMQPIIENGTSYVPLRVISEAFGIEPQWDDSTKTVIINCDTSSTNQHTQETISLIEQFSPEMAEQYITADFTDIVVNSYPYYDNESKFYLFDARDQYGEIYLKISYGGYMTAIPKTVSTPTESVGSTDAPAETVTEPPVETAIEAPAEIVTETQAETDVNSSDADVQSTDEPVSDLSSDDASNADNAEEATKAPAETSEPVSESTE